MRFWPSAQGREEGTALVSGHGSNSEQLVHAGGEGRAGENISRRRAGAVQLPPGVLQTVSPALRLSFLTC